MRHHAIVLFLLACAVSVPAPVAAAPVSTRIMLFNLTPAGAYEVQRNGVVAAQAVASPAGGIDYTTTASPGDRFEFMQTGLDPVSPARPAGLVATGRTDGCVDLAWTPPASTDYVTGYSLLWGASAQAYTDSVHIDGLDIARGASWRASRCGFADGTYVFALRAHNAFDRWSAPSAPVLATIGNSDTQGPLPPTNPRVSETTPGCASLAWTRSGDATVAGYRVYFGTRPRSQADYTDSFDAGNNAAAERCGLARGTYYFALRSYTGAGVMSAFSKEIALTAKGTDVAAPAIANRVPASGATDVPLNTTIFFVATDDGAGIDASSIAVTVDGVTRNVRTVAAPGGLAIQCTAAGNLPPGSDIEVSLSVADRATPPNVATRAYTFRTGTAPVTEADAPLLTAVSPAQGGESADTRPSIELRVRDAGHGVDIASLELDIDGQPAAFTFDGTPSDARIRTRPAVAFAPGAVVTVRLDACDGAGECAALDYEFTVGAAAAASAAIVPDGYWARDPARPLEIRNLPPNWGVRIFDVSGALVRHHENGAGETTWTWNFHSDDGRRVAPALYLVRITDAGGSVQRSGRFLVQSGP